ncbi:MAG: universal stress protein [Chitinophagaceae bacterium]|nr:MAG: universal stress protein [Chitinophagaceae bacterium]
MKTIIVPTDFSTAAEHAALYAAELAKAMNASVLLLHVYQLPITMNDFPVMIVSADELKKNADAGLRRVQEEMQKKVSGVNFEMESRMGDVVQEIENACADRDVVALVAGTKDLGSFERFLTGNTTLSIIKNCTYPVIAVPEDAVLKTPKRVALAVDLSHADEIPVQKITELTQSLKAELHVVHVEQEGETKPEQALPDNLRNATYHSFKDEDVAKGLAHFVADKAIDLVIVLPHKHNLYERIFFKGHTKDLIQSIPVPVLCIQN